MLSYALVIVPALVNGLSEHISSTPFTSGFTSGEDTSLDPVFQGGLDKVPALPGYGTPDLTDNVLHFSTGSLDNVPSDSLVYDPAFGLDVDLSPDHNGDLQYVPTSESGDSAAILESVGTLEKALDTEGTLNGEVPSEYNLHSHTRLDQLKLDATQIEDLVPGESRSLEGSPPGDAPDDDLGVSELNSGMDDLEALVQN